MSKKIKPYNYSYRVAMRFLNDNRKAELANVYLWTITHLNPKHNFSKEGVKRAWYDFNKPKTAAEILSVPEQLKAWWDENTINKKLARSSNDAADALSFMISTYPEPLTKSLNIFKKNI